MSSRLEMKYSYFEPANIYWDISKMANVIENMYVEIKDYGLTREIVHGSGRSIVEAYCKMVPKYGFIAIAEKERSIIGMSWGKIKTVPPYLGGGLTGFWEGLYVFKEYRREGVASSLYNMTEEWYRSKNIDSIELQVLFNNDSSRRMCKVFGFENELIQMRKVL